MQKFLLSAGAICLAAGLIWPLLQKIGPGRLPGDIVFQGEHVKFYFPIVTCIILSLLISALLWLFNR